MDTCESLRCLLQSLELVKGAPKQWRYNSNSREGERIDEHYSPLLVHCTASQVGLRLLTRRSRALGARAYFKASLCRLWKVTGGEAISFTVSLQRLHQALKMFTPQARLTLSVEAQTEHVRLVIEENEVVVECDLACVMSGDDDGDEGSILHDEARERFQQHPIAVSCLLEAAQLHACLIDLDVSGCDQMAMIWQSHFPRLRFATFMPSLAIMTGIAAKPGQTTDSMQSFHIAADLERQTHGPLVFSYSHSLVKLTTNMTTTADSTLITVNSVGVLKMNHTYKTFDPNTSNFCEVICDPLSLDQQVISPVLAPQLGQRIANDAFDLN